MGVPGVWSRQTDLLSCDQVHECSCSHAMVSRYQKRISGSLPDRADLRSDDIHIEVPRAEYEKLSDDRLGEPSDLGGAGVHRPPGLATGLVHPGFLGGHNPYQGSRRAIDPPSGVKHRMGLSSRIIPLQGATATGYHVFQSFPDRERGNAWQTQVPLPTHSMPGVVPWFPPLAQVQRHASNTRLDRP
jgi:hypothetical protein